MLELLRTLWDLVLVLGRLTSQLLWLVLAFSLILFWCGWWLRGVNWKKAWPILAQGAWVPLLLVMVLSALVWSQIAPSPCDCLAPGTVPNFWWQLGAVGLLVASALFCGWLQGVFGWTPPEISVEPTGHGHGGHGHEHEHEHTSADHSHAGGHGHGHIHESHTHGH